MSLIIGIDCTDGIVIGADSAATFGAAGRYTIRQSARKLHAVRETALIACAGHAGLAQRYQSRLDEILGHSVKGRAVTDLPGPRLAGMLHEEFFKETEQHLKSLALGKDIFGLAHSCEGLAGTIVALPSETTIALLFLDELCNAELTTSDLPFISLGSGRFIADPFLAFLKRVLWDERQPALSMGELSTVWTLQHAIDTNSGGVTGPLHVATLSLRNDKPHIHFLTNDEINVHLIAVKELEATMAEAARHYEEQDSSPPPEL